MHSKTFLLTILVTLPFFGFALSTPHGLSGISNPRVLHRDTHTVAFDEENYQLIAFDRVGRELGVYAVDAELPGHNQELERRGASVCSPMKNEDIKNIPGIGRLRETADKKWSTRSRREVVNDKDFPDRSANICVDNAGATVVYEGKPTCRTTINEAEGKLENGVLTIESKEGLSMSSKTTVTKTSKWGVGITYKTGIEFPGIADVKSEISTTTEFINKQGEARDASADFRTLQRISQPVDGVNQCKVTLSTNTCRFQGRASVKMVASGFLWFQYHDRVKGHYKWGMVMERELPNINDRASTTEFKTTGNLKTSGHFSASGCTEGESTGFPVGDTDTSEPFDPSP